MSSSKQLQNYKDSLREGLLVGRHSPPVNPTGITGDPCRHLVGRWSAKDFWESARGQVEDKLRTETEQKFVEKVSENISDDLSKLATSHLQSHRVFHEIAIAIGQDWLDKIRTNPDAIDSINLKAVALASVMLDRAIAGERVAAALHYQDLNKAVEALHKHGYLVVDPNLDLDPRPRPNNGSSVCPVSTATKNHTKNTGHTSLI